MAWRSLLLFAAVVAAGCRTPPARVACYEPGKPAPKREVVFAKHVVADSLETLVHHPAESAATFLSGTARFV